MIKKKPSKASSKKNVSMPLAINIMRFQNYNFKFFATDEVVMFEYLIVKAVSFKHRVFYHSSNTINNETGIKRNRENSILERFENDLKIVTVKVTGMPQVKHFKVHFHKFVPLLRKIYQFNKFSAENRKLLVDYFKSLAENN